MSILSTSPTSTRHFDMNIAVALGDVNAAVMLQQLDYWLQKEGVGVIVDGIKYIYNSYRDWTSQQFRWLSERQFRKSMDLLRSLEIVKVIRYKSKQWNQTNYYSIDYDRLGKFLGQEKPESTETVELTARADRGDKNGQIEMTESDISLNEPKITNQKKLTTKTSDPAHFQCARERASSQNPSDRDSSKSNQFAAASLKKALEEEKNQKQSNPHSDHLTAVPSQNKAQSEAAEIDTNKETNNGKVDSLVNQEWRSLIPLLDSTGIPINKTLKDLLKLYPSEKVEGAIAIVRARKREKYIPNPSGYFVSALEGDWASKNLVSSESDRNCEKIDEGAIFRHWYDLARSLGYCSGQEVREGEQWICLSGSWEKWSAAVERGYSLDYLKKIIQRNQGR